MQEQKQQYTDILKALDATRNIKALALVIGTFIAAVVVFIGGAATGSIAGAGLLGIVGMLLMIAGINAAGIVLSHEAIGAEAPGYGDALLGGAGSFIKIILVSLLLMLCMMVYTIVATLVLLVCKIPGIGPLLYAVVLPVLILLSGMLFVGLYTCGALTLPAIWQGETVVGAFKMAIAIAMQRLIEVVIRLLLLGLLMGIVGGVIGMVVGVGSFYSLGISAAILPVGSGMEALLGIASGFGGSGHIVAAGFGMGVVFALTGAVVTCIGLAGLIRTYLGVSSGIDTSAVSEFIEKRQEELRQKKAQMEEELRRRKAELDAKRREAEAARAAEAAAAEKAAAEKAAAEKVAAEAAAAEATPVIAAPSAAAVTEAATPMPTQALSRHCPKCGTAAGSDDVFCGNCGNRLP